MEEQKTSSDVLRKEILEQSKAEAKSILDQAEQEKAKALSEAKASAEQVKTETLRKVQLQADAARKRVLSGVHLEVKKQTLQVREDAVRKISGMVREKLDAFRKAKEYGPFLRKLVMEGVLALDSGNLTVVPGDVERPLLTGNFLNGIADEAKKLGKTVQLTLSKNTLPEGGVILESADGRTRFDNSFSARSQRYDDAMRMVAAKALS